MQSSTDQMGRTITISGKPQRIISLVPSQTELLYDLGLEKEIAGITKFCIHPREWFRNKTKVGGTKTVKLELIQKLHPDLIIANKEENVQAQVEELAKHYPVWVSVVNTLADALHMISELGRITSTNEKAAIIIKEIEQRFNELQIINARYNEHGISKKKIKKESPIDGGKENQDNLTERFSPNAGLPLKGSVLTPSDLKPATNNPTVYLIWKDPYMAAGGDTFINDMLQYCGLHNAFSHLSRYPVISIDQLQTSHLQYILLSSEPYPFSSKHIEELQQQLPAAKIILADGEMFSWYGSRLLQSPMYFKELMQLLRQ